MHECCYSCLVYFAYWKIAKILARPPTRGFRRLQILARPPTRGLLGDYKFQRSRRHMVYQEITNSSAAADTWFTRRLQILARPPTHGLLGDYKFQRGRRHVFLLGDYKAVTLISLKTKYLCDEKKLRLDFNKSNVHSVFQSENSNNSFRLCFLIITNVLLFNKID